MLSGFLITYHDGKTEVVASSRFSDTGMLQRFCDGEAVAIEKIEPIQIATRRTEDGLPVVYGSSRSRFSTREIVIAVEQSPS